MERRSVLKIMKMEQCMIRQCDFCRNKEKCDKRIDRYDTKKKEKKTLQLG